MFNRIIGVLRLDPKVYEEIEHDPAASTQAVIIVAVIAFLSAIGSGVGSAIGRGRFGTSFIGTLIWTFVGWVLWSLVSYFVATAFFHGQGTTSGMLRVIGFAMSPLAFGIIPCIGAIVGWIWSLATGFVAVRQGANLDNLRAFFTILIGFLVYLIGAAFIGLVLGGALAIFNLPR